MLSDATNISNEHSIQSLVVSLMFFGYSGLLDPLVRSVKTEVFSANCCFVKRAAVMRSLAPLNDTSNLSKHLTQQPTRNSTLKHLMQNTLAWTTLTSDSDCCTTVGIKFELFTVICLVYVCIA